MFRVDTSTAVTSQPTPGPAGTQGYFQSGNPQTGTPATIPGADWFNIVQEELANLVEYYGLTLDKTDQTQLRQAIRAAIDRSSRDLATKTQAEAGTDNARVMTPLRTAQAIAALASNYRPTAVVHADNVAVGRVNDYRSGKSATADIIQLSRSSNFDLTGLADGVAGRELRLQCTGGGDITLKHNSSRSAAGNRIWLSPAAWPGGEVELQQGDTATLLYMRYNAAVGSVWVLCGVTQAQVPEATTSVKGVVEFATQAEGLAGTATDKAMTPALAKAVLGAAGGGLKKLEPDSRGRVAIPRGKWIFGYSLMDKAANGGSASYELHDVYGNALTMNWTYWSNQGQPGRPVSVGQLSNDRNFLGNSVAHWAKFIITDRGKIRLFSQTGLGVQVKPWAYQWFGEENSPARWGQLYAVNRSPNTYSTMSFYSLD